MFPKNGQGWTLSQIDEMDVHFFYELASEFEFDDEPEQTQEQDVYLEQIW